jgi:hypothetical protein
LILEVEDAFPGFAHGDNVEDTYLKKVTMMIEEKGTGFAP